MIGLLLLDVIGGSVLVGFVFVVGVVVSMVRDKLYVVILIMWVMIFMVIYFFGGMGGVLFGVILVLIL